jgi:cytochrome P450
LAQSMTRPESTEKRVAAQLAVEGYLQSWIDQRRSNLGSDMLSSIISGDVLGRPVSNLEALMMSVSLLLGGLDTVANMLCFVAIYLARNPRQRQQLIDRPELIPPAIEELIRRHGIVALGRRIVQDTSLQGVMLLNGDMIQAPSMLYGIDETIVEDPLTVNFERESSPHIAFGHGPHLCPGQHLARRELTIFVEEWLKRIPDFEVKPGTMPVIETGLTSGVTRLELSWLPPN